MPNLGHEIWGPITGPAGSEQAVIRALGRCTLDFGLLKPGLLQGNEWSTPGKTQIPVNVRSLANFAKEAEEQGLHEGIDYHAIMVDGHGNLIDHNHELPNGVVANVDDVAPAVLGLFWFSGLVEVEESLLSNPALFDEVFHSEGAHATDFFYMLPTGKRNVAHAIICNHSPKHAWFQPTPYFDQPGEGLMGIIVKGFTNLPVTLQGFSHPAVEPTVGLIKNLLMPADPPPPEEPPVTEPMLLPNGLYDARPFVTNPQGRGAMGTVIGHAIHHTVTALRSIEASLLAADLDAWAATQALMQTEMLSAETTFAQEIEHIKVIDRAHVNAGFGGFAYHWLACPSGRVYQTGDFTGMRAHVAQRNHELHGGALVGDFSSSLPAEVQLQGAAKGIKAVRLSTGQLPIKGHNEWATPGNATVCAGRLNGFDWTPYLEPGTQPPGVPHNIEITVNSDRHGTVRLSDGSSYPIEVEPFALTFRVKPPG